MKVLFLDIDGVLNGHEKHPSSPYTTIRPDCILRLNSIVKVTGCKIVISSAWRYMMFRSRRNRAAPMTLLGFQYMLHTHGLLGASAVIVGNTCSDEEITLRGEQILFWCNKNKIGPLDWAAVDDMDFTNEIGSHASRLVIIKSKNGMRDVDAQKLISLLS